MYTSGPNFFNIMWVPIWIILIFSLGGIHAQSGIRHFNSSSEITTEGNQLNITCIAHPEPKSLHMNMYITKNGRSVCQFRSGSGICDRDGRTRMLSDENGRRICQFGSGSGICNRYSRRRMLYSNRNYYSCCSNGIVTEDVNLIVIINGTRKEDNGTWVCKTESSNQSLQVFVNYPPSINNITIEPADDIIIEGTDVKLSCFVDSYPQSNITWTLNDEVGNNHSPDLEIENVTCQDSGRYEAICIAQNGIGQSAMESNVNVYCKPRLNPKQSPQRQMIVPLEDSMTLTATVMAYPAPTFTWKHLLEDKSEKNITDCRMTTKSANLTSSLHITDIKEHDYGYYIMYAENENGKTSVTFTLKKTADDNKLGTGIGIGFVIGLVVMIVIQAIVLFICKQRGSGVDLKQMFHVKKRTSRTNSAEVTPTTRKPSTSPATTVTFVKKTEETYEGLDASQPRVEQTYEGLLPDKTVKKAYEEQDIYENQ